MYGIKKHVAVSSSNTYMQSWYNATGIRYETTLDKYYGKAFLNYLVDSEDGQLSEHANMFSESNRNINTNNISQILLNGNQETKEVMLVAYFASVIKEKCQSNSSYDNPEKQKAYNDTRREFDTKSNEKFLENSGDSAGIVVVTQDTKNEQGLVFGFSGSTENNNGGNAIMLNAIDTMGKFYLNNVATYVSKYITDDNSDNSKHASTDRAYNKLLANGTISSSSSGFKRWNVTLIENEEIKLIPIVGRFGYKSSELDRIALDNEKGADVYADYAGDDCSGFASAVLRIANNGKRGQNGSLETIGYGAVKDIDAESFMNQNSPNSKALFNLGYEMYKKESGNWERYYLNNGRIAKDNNPINMSIKSLEPGDMLICKATPSHIEFYVGSNYPQVYDELLNNATNKALRNERKKSYDWENKFPKRSGVNTSTGSGNTLRVEGTFSWGTVRDEYPSESIGGARHYFYYDTTNNSNVFRHCECGFWNPTNERQHHSSCSINPNNEHYGREYTVIWRKK